jgi:hypothetical protein
MLLNHRTISRMLSFNQTSDTFDKLICAPGLNGDASRSGEPTDRKTLLA